MADALKGVTDTAGGLANQATQQVGGLANQAQQTAGGLTKQTPLRADFERKADQLQRRKPRTQRYDDYEDDESSDPEFHFPERHGKHRLVPVRTSRIADRPISDKDSTMKIKIELDLEVEVEIYARVKGDVTLGLL